MSAYSYGGDVPGGHWSCAAGGLAPRTPEGRLCATEVVACDSGSGTGTRG